MRVLSLFDGIGCAALAFKRAGIEIEEYYSSEIDKNCLKLLETKYPNHIQLGDICQIADEDVPVVDIVVGGSPCTSFSRSGNGTGFDGESGLFWEFVRVLNTTKKKNPNVLFLLENVVMKKEWQDIITGALGVEPIMIDSTLVSAQKRQRLYWTNIQGVEQPQDKGTILLDVVRSVIDSKDAEKLGTDFKWYDEELGSYCVVNGTTKGYLEVSEFDSVNLDFPTSKTRRGRVGKLKANTLNTGCNQGFFFDGEVYKFNALECERLQTLPDNYTEGFSDSIRRNMIGNGWTVDVISHIFSYIPKVSKWDKRFMDLAHHISEWSKDTTKVGAVITQGRRVVSTGYNGIPAGIEDTEYRMQRPQKYMYIEHAERNAIYNTHEDLTGTTLYCTYFPCHECAGAIVSKNIAEVVAPAPDFDHPTWGESFIVSYEKLSEKGVKITYI